MQLRNPELQIPEDTPFDVDELNRERSAQILTKLLRNVQTPIVLSLDSPWGTGKTTFVRMWKQALLNDGIQSLYFNAWENDFTEDPFVGFISELEEQIVNNEDGRSKKAKHFKKVKQTGVKIVKRSIPLIVKLLSHGILDLAKLSNEDIEAFAENIASDAMANFQEEQKNMVTFREHLQSFIAELNNPADVKSVRLVFFIDELDRCKPTYAVLLLERLKHLFNVPGIVFVLSVDMEQIKHSMKALYGSGMDADGYLRKFIDLDYRLPPPDSGHYCAFVFKRLGFNDVATRTVPSNIKTKIDHALSVLGDLSEILGLSLRDIEQAVVQMGIVLSTFSNQSYEYFPSVLAILLAIKAANPSLYRNYTSGSVGGQEIINLVESTPKGSHYFSRRKDQKLKAIILCGMATNETLSVLIRKIEKNMSDSNFDHSEKSKLDNLKASVKALLSTKEHMVVKDMISRLALTEDFSV